MLRRFSKPLGRLNDFKQAFFEQNDSQLAEYKKIADLYKAQLRRKRCKNCDNALSKQPTFFCKFGIEYAFCQRCNHLNGAYEDTEEFCSALYTGESGSEYTRDYTEEDARRYSERTEEIYIPKADFLKESLRELGESPEEMSVCDFGTGAGYFLAAAKKCGFKNVTGYDPSQSLIDFGNSMLGSDLLQQKSIGDTAQLVENCNAAITSFIGVIEHLQRPRDILQALQSNPSIEYVFISVPLFSPTVVLENIFSDVMPRHLVAGHTHLYTDKSIDYFCEEYGFDRAAEWLFGLDINDLFRSVSVLLGKKYPQENVLKEYWEKRFPEVIDELQSVLDKRRMCSEIHFLLKKKSV